MNNFNRHSSHGHHGSKCRELAQHAYSHGSHALFHTLISTRLQPRCAKRQLSYYYSVHAGSLRVFVIHQTLTWTTGSLSCILNMIILVHAYTHGGWAHRQRVSTTFLTQKNSHIFLALLTGFKPRFFRSQVRTSTN